MNGESKCFGLNSEFKIEVVLVTYGCVINYPKLSDLKQPVYFAHDVYIL